MTDVPGPTVATEAFTGPVDLHNCDREPIHIPGSIQEHGALVVVTDDGRVVQVSRNCADLLRRDPASLLGSGLAELFDTEDQVRLRSATPSPGQLHAGSCTVTVGGVRLDAVVAPSNGLTVLAFERADDTDPVAPYEHVRTSVLALTATSGIEELCAATARSVRGLTGFDRVMVYRFDEAWNGEVVAEDKRDDLHPFLGLHYPATDIPAQARELYRRNWVRSIPDIHYAPVPLEPVENPVTRAPLDLSLSPLRSVSPIHVEYLGNMGVAASMSVSLLVGGELWGLIACHHYAGPHYPTVPVRSAAEFLGQTVSALLTTKIDADAREAEVAVQRKLAALVADLDAEDDLSAEAIAAMPEVRGLIDADGVAVRLDGQLATAGNVPPEDVVEEIAAWLRRPDGSGGDDGTVRPDQPVATDRLGIDEPAFTAHKDVASGVMGVFPGSGTDRYVVWFRPEVVRTVDWGGDPKNKVIAVTEDETIRLSPRRSFAAWKETVGMQATAWRDVDHRAAGQLAGHLTRTLLRAAQEEIHAARTLQRKLAPERLPEIPGVHLAARYEPGDSRGGVGGDWYDVFVAPDGKIVVALGDVAGHGITAAAVMAQMQSALRAYLFSESDPVGALRRLDRLINRLLPEEMATAVVLTLDPATGGLRMACAGHLPPVIVGPDGAELVKVEGPALGIAELSREEVSRHLAPGHALLLYTDGLVERRGERIDRGIERLRTVAAEVAGSGPEVLCDHLLARQPPGGGDDVALVAVTWEGVQGSLTT